MFFIEEGKKKTCSQTADLSFLCNFKLISSPFSKDNLKRRSSLVLFFFLVGGKKQVINVGMRVVQAGPKPTWAIIVFSLVSSFLSAP